MTRPEDKAAAAKALEDPFAVLGIAPTESLAEVKRAYFAMLSKHPPHSDPVGFHRVRSAYEQLMKPGALATVAWTSTFDREAALRALDGRLGPRLEARRRERAQAAGGRVLRGQFERIIATASWQDLVRGFGPDTD